MSIVKRKRRDYRWIGRLTPKQLFAWLLVSGVCIVLTTVVIVITVLGLLTFLYHLVNGQFNVLVMLATIITFLVAGYLVVYFGANVWLRKFKNWMQNPKGFKQ